MKKSQKKWALVMATVMAFSGMTYAPSVQAKVVEKNSTTAAATDADNEENGTVTPTTAPAVTATPTATTAATTTPVATATNIVASSTPNSTATPVATTTATAPAVTATPIATATATAPAITTTPVATSEATETPVNTTVPTAEVPATEVPAPTNAVPTQVPDTTTGGAIETPAPTSAVPTQTPDPTTGGAITGPAIETPAPYEVGQTFTYGNYNYKVTKAYTSTASGEVTLTKIATTAQSKSTLSVPATIKPNGYSYKVTFVGARAFKDCTSLKKITFLGNVKTIGTGAFYGAKNLTTVNLPSTVTFIQKNAFNRCSSLRRINLPSGLKTIGIRAFYNCSNLRAIVVEGTSITTIKSGAFGNRASGCYMIVPSGKKQTYSRLVKNCGAKKMVFYTF